MDAKTVKAIEKLLGLKEYSATFWIADDNWKAISGSERKIKMKAKDYDEARNMAHQEVEKMKEMYQGFNIHCCGLMDETREQYLIMHGEL